MADGNEDERASAALGERKKFRKIITSAQTMNYLSEKAAFAAMKQEAENIQRAGVQLLLQKPEMLPPLQSKCLSSFAGQAYEDTEGHEYVHDTQIAYQYFHPEEKEWQKTGTVEHLMDQEATLNLYIKIVSRLKMGVEDVDKKPTFWLDSSDGKAPAPRSHGGFQELYDKINVPPRQHSKQEQARCVFGMSLTTFYKVAGPASKPWVKNLTQTMSENADNQPVSCDVVHVLFNWNAHSFFTYHQDPDGDMTAIVNLTHGESTMSVAGFEEATYHGVGSTHIFPSKAFHRSGTAPRRCVKIAFFYKAKAPIPLEESDHEEQDAATPGGKAKIVEYTDDIPTPLANSSEEVKKEGEGSSSAFSSA